MHISQQQAIPHNADCSKSNLIFAFLFRPVTSSELQQQLCDKFYFQPPPHQCDLQRRSCGRRPHGKSPMIDLDGEIPPGAPGSVLGGLFFICCTET